MKLLVDGVLTIILFAGMFFVQDWIIRAWPGLALPVLAGWVLFLLWQCRRKLPIPLRPRLALLGKMLAGALYAGIILNLAKAGRIPVEVAGMLLWAGIFFYAFYPAIASWLRRRLDRGKGRVS